MKIRLRSSRENVVALAVVLLIAVVPSTSQPAPPAGYVQTNLVSDTIDPDLVNAWGMSFSSTSFIWVSDNGTGVATLYNATGAKQSLVVTIPLPPGSNEDHSAPTGQLFHNGPGFEVDPVPVIPGHPAVFIFVTENGTIAGWNPSVDTAVPPSTPSRNAVLKVDRSLIGAVYKGVAFNKGAAPDGSQDRLYATNFRFGSVEVFDPTWKLVDSVTDPSIPPGYAPFNIQSLDGKLYVTFAKQGDDREDDAAGPGRGFVDILDPATNTFTRLISGHPGKAPLNSPWGLAIAPPGFGEFGGALLVGNFGDGKINAFDPDTGAHLGSLRRSHGGDIKIDGLWALAFGISGNNGSPNTLFFTAGPDHESRGFFGKLEAAP